ncbi:MAG TPA: molybdopterin molybdotransferase MoeA, partial [Clostridia bacterium]|nr:molybdopterin molybdotransferase MoeA [Clostridia bacterium]
DSVVMIEQTSKIGEEIFIYHPVKSRENMITEGEDFAKGSIIASKGALLTSAKIGVLASAGISRVKIFKPMTFSLISTGDEIIPITQELIDCKIRDTNSHLLQALYAPLGATISKIIIKDDLNDLIKAIGEGLATSDIIIISGGSSVGYRDYTEKAILHYTDDIFIKGIALKPGKPTMAGYLNGQLILGLPGNPMAAYVALSKVFLDGVYDAFNVKKRAKIFARAKINFPSAAGRATVMPIKLEESDTGYLATPLFYKSGLIGILSKADGYTIISESEEGIPKDTLLEVFPL